MVDDFKEQITGQTHEAVNSLCSANDMNLKKRLDSRVVYSLPNGNDIKVAINHDGLIQNFNEVKISVKGGYEDIINPALDYDKDPRRNSLIPWVEAQPTKPITENQFVREKGFSFDEFSKYLVWYGGSRKAYSPQQPATHAEESIRGDGFADKIIDMCKQFEIDLCDMTDILQYGTSEDDSIVITDYGMAFLTGKR